MEEIWVKVGGDKGGTSAKNAFQLCNVPHPNSIQNTCVFAVFEAKDTPTNLHIALDRYREQITSLQSFIWRLVLRCTVMIRWLTLVLGSSGKRFRLFLCGDYEYLCRMYGITGASGTVNSS